MLCSGFLMALLESPNRMPDGGRFVGVLGTVLATGSRLDVVLATLQELATLVSGVTGCLLGVAALTEASGFLVAASGAAIVVMFCLVATCGTGFLAGGIAGGPFDVPRTCHAMTDIC